MFISILATGGLVYYLNSVYKKTGNIIIKADALHYKMDLFTNISIVGTLLVLYFLP
jgi:divalent metal cation (Fe/Co/Zn/Cd) transporter